MNTTITVLSKAVAWIEYIEAATWEEAEPHYETCTKGCGRGGWGCVIHRHWLYASGNRNRLGRRIASGELWCYEWRSPRRPRSEHLWLGA